MNVDDLQMLQGYYEQYNISHYFSQEILSKLKLIKFSRLEYLCQEQEEMKHLMLLVKGKTKVFKTLANGKNLLINFGAPLEIVGEIELIKGCQAICTVQALTTCYVLALPMPIVAERLEKDPQFLQFVCHSMADKLKELVESSSVNQLYPLENRLASYIGAASVKERDGGNVEKLMFNENLTMLADLLGSSYRHLLRTLNSMCQKEILVKEEHGYRVINKAQLAQLAGDLYE